MSRSAEQNGRPIAFLAALGDASNPDTWSSIPCHFLQAGRTTGLLDEGLPINPFTCRVKYGRILWNLARPLLGDGMGGYQYTTGLLERLWRPVRQRIAGGVVINHFQLYPPSVVHDPRIEKWFYVDATLSLLFDQYKPLVIGRRIHQDALKREKEGYLAARGVVTMSAYAARSVVHDYGVPPQKVHVVIPGANITAELYDRWEKQHLARFGDAPAPTNSPLKIVFIGSPWHRKGLDRLLRAVQIVHQKGLKVTLSVIGQRPDGPPPELRDVPGVRWLGVISRRTDAERFLRVVSECDIGCTPSRVEMAGIAYREYLALGLVVIGSTAGGAGEMLAPDASVAVDPQWSDEQIADVLLNFDRDKDAFQRMRTAAWRQRRTALWDKAVERFFAFWPHPRAPVADAYGADHARPAGP